MANEEGELSHFSVLPGDCTATILSFTSPEDACRLAVVSDGFRSAMNSDNVWEMFLPTDYQRMLSESASPPVTYVSKKELYFHFCDSPLLLHGGKLLKDLFVLSFYNSFWLSKRSGKKCYMLCARELGIDIGNDPRCWQWTSLPESRFGEVAELIEVCWLKITGKLQSQLLSPNTNYIAYLVYKLTKEHGGLECSSRASVWFHEGGSTTEIEGATNEIVYIERPMNRCENGHFPVNRRDGWIEIELGTSFNGENIYNVDIHMQLSETVELWWKRGLLIQGIEVRPKEMPYILVAL